ncbi:MAG: glycosidase [Bacteroidia bacterium]|nr:glycosidase [Bacteroidia bacterium]NNF31753.1 glycosidase [Flavobacteriaceae bacterium]NNK55267.1 glycosidase [Flavobacteriaceae bacterium]NNM10262.1 glycosidase [Flavobacteriaceae bacterium]
MKKNLLRLFFLIFTTSLLGQANKVTVSNATDGQRLIVDGKEIMVNGMNWDYIPIGETIATTTYQFWNQPDDIIKDALDAEMALLKNMGVNVIRQYVGVPPKWVQYIYENYGIYTMINHTFGRYGLTIGGAWQPNTDYSDPRVREILKKEVTQMANDFKDTPGILLFMLGNENNYGLFWDGAETEDIPMEDRRSTKRARPMYKLFNEGSLWIKEVVNDRPVAICNGDLLFLDIIAEECTDIDIFGTNMYRGTSFGDAFERVKNEYGKPLLLAEFGSDAFNAVQNQEDQQAQAHYMVENWKEIYANAAGLGKTGNSLGGFTFQFSDGWWKFGQTKNLDAHDNNASWENGGYKFDHVEGENNMNEEWFGICAKGPTNERGLYTLYPRAAYYALKEAHQYDPYTMGATMGSLEEHFGKIQIIDAVLRARGDKALAGGGGGSGGGGKIRLSTLRAEITTFNTGGKRITTPEDPVPNDPNTYPNQLGFDNMESYFIGVEGNPMPGLRANVVANVLGNVAANPINEIFYENRGRPILVESSTGENQLITDNNRVAIYQADFSWNSKYVNMTGFYRTGHYHWGYEGDFFGLYPEANYGPNLDIYNGLTPFGFEFEGKKELKGLKVAFGPELWWGANPAILAKYSTTIGDYAVTGIFHEDISEPRQAVTSIAIPQPRTRRATLFTSRKFGKWEVGVGGIWAGQPLNDREYQIVQTDANGNQQVLVNTIDGNDNWGGKAKVTYTGGKLNWYASGAAQGLVANGGPDATRTFTGWRLKDTGSGNQYNFLTGLTYTIGNLQIAPNFMWQEPIVDPIPIGAPAPARSRNILDDPFVVRANRKTTAGEILLTWDPTPGSWFYEWDNDRAEDAPFAASLGFNYRSLSTTQDASIGFFEGIRDPIAFDGAPPAEDLWEFNGRVVSKLSTEFGLVANFYGGNGQANGPDDRVIYRYGGDIRAIYKKIKLTTEVKIDDWGPFDYHRDFNLTYPFQFMADLSTTVGKPNWFILPNTRLGIRYIYRTTDNFSPRFEFQNPIDQGFPNGNEWEIRTYVHINIGK